MTHSFLNRVKIGRYYINVNVLNSNVLSLTTKYNKKVMHDSIISDKFKHLIYELLKDRNIVDKISLLSNYEQVKLRDFLEKTDLIDQIDLVKNPDMIDKRKDQMIHRFNILRDEFFVGNYSDDMVHEFKDLLEEMKMYKYIRKNEYNKIKKIIDGI